MGICVSHFLKNLCNTDKFDFLPILAFCRESSFFLWSSDVVCGALIGVSLLQRSKLSINAFMRLDFIPLPSKDCISSPTCSVYESLVWSHSLSDFLKNTAFCPYFTSSNKFLLISSSTFFTVVNDKISSLLPTEWSFCVLPHAIFTLESEFSNLYFLN